MRAYQGKEQEHFHSVNEAFWKSAVGEFKEKMAQKEETFKSLNVQIFDLAKKMFREIASDEKQRLAHEIDQRLNSQSIPMSDKDRELLISCSCQKIKDLRKKWESGPGAQKKQIDRSRIILLLRDLEKLKLQLQLQTQILQLLDQSAPSISAYGVVEFMFNLVLNRMGGGQWGCVTSQDSLEPADHAYTTGESSSQTTMVMTNEP